jgi:hypothetical protein
METSMKRNMDTDTYIQNTGQYQTMLNGNIVDKTNWSVAYDGDELNLEASQNDEAIYMKLNADELMKLFELPAYHEPIDKRLEDNLREETEIDVRPIIIEEIENILHKQNSRERK